HVAAWRGYATEGPSTFEVLQRRLPQLCIPIREGVSSTPAYARVARQGAPFAEEAFDGKLTLTRPERLDLRIHEHMAGALPVLMTDCRVDFETLTRALAHRSEPVPVHPSVNAHLVGGFINWDRVSGCRKEWLARTGTDASAAWPAEL